MIIFAVTALLLIAFIVFNKSSSVNSDTLTAEMQYRSCQDRWKEKRVGRHATESNSTSVGQPRAIKKPEVISMQRGVDYLSYEQDSYFTSQNSIS